MTNSESAALYGRYVNLNITLRPCTSTERGKNWRGMNAQGTNTQRGTDCLAAAGLRCQLAVQAEYQISKTKGKVVDQTILLHLYYIDHYFYQLLAQESNGG